MSAELAWFKSSYSSPDGDNCVEVALDWQKSSYSSAQGDNCVEVAVCPAAVHVRDSKDRHGPTSPSPAKRGPRSSRSTGAEVRQSRTGHGRVSLRGDLIGKWRSLWVGGPKNPAHGRSRDSR